MELAFSSLLVYSENRQPGSEKLGKTGDRSFYLTNKNARDNGQLVKSAESTPERDWSNFTNVHGNQA